MRKFLILALSLIMILSLAACGGSSDEITDNGEITDNDNTSIAPPTDAPEVTDEPTVTDAPEVTDEPETDEVTADVTTDQQTYDTAPVETEFVEVNETVYVYGTGTLNVRREPSTSSEKMGTMSEGEQVTRVGYNSEWSKISYYGNLYYASSAYLTTSAPLDFDDKTDVVYIIAEGTLNLRKKPSLNADIAAVLTRGTELARTGIATEEDSEGITWSRVLYNGEVCYVSSALLSEEKPPLSDVENDFETCNENIYVARKNGEKPIEKLNVRALPSLNSNIIAVLEPDTQLLRVGIAKVADDEGIIWSMVIYDGKTGYVSSNYVTTDAPASDEATNSVG